MNKNSKKSLIAWILAGITGLVVFIMFFNQAFPTASIDLRLSKEEVIEKATEFVTEQGFQLEGFDRTIVFDSDYYASIYLQKTQGIAKANQLIRQGVPMWFWQVRWFKELQKDGFSVYIDPATGEIVHFQYAVLDDAQGANLTLEQAKKIAEQKVLSQGIDLEVYKVKENINKEQKNRTDYSFSWEKKDYTIGDATLIVSANIYGDKLGYFGRYLKIPEDFIRDLQKDLSYGQVLSILTVIFMFVLGISALVVMIIQFKKDNVSWKPGLAWGAGVALLAIIAFVNSIPLLWTSYPDTMSKNIFVVISAAAALIGSLVSGLVIFLFWASGEALSREVWSRRFPLLEALKKKEFKSAEVFSPIITGYCLAFLFLGYITIFYLVGRKFFHIWMPPEVEYSNILGTALPFLFPLTLAVTAAVSEEFMFRMFSISFFKKCFKLTWLGILLPAVIWAFAHSNYPVFPAYVRGIELTIAGIVFGIVYVKYGLETVLITHFVIDAVLGGLPLLRSHNLYFTASGAIVMLAVFIPVIILFFMAKKTKGDISNGVSHSSV
ncbi:MAG: CPBP family glutamic-type intramembrane protease [Candidatus Omnitrophota bacterium]